MSLLLVILGLLLFIGLVVGHEFGHFIMARRGGVDVDEFGIGFPPRVWKKRIKSPKGNFNLTLNALPLGGFVKLKGENDADRSPGSYGAASLSTKVKIMIAGVVMNLLTAFVLLTFLALVGMPKLVENQFSVNSDARTVRQEVLVAALEDGSPAAQAGILPHDRLVSIGPAPQNCLDDCVIDAPTDITDSNMLPRVAKQFAGQPILVTYQRGKARYAAEVTLRTQEVVERSRKTDTPKGYIGIVPTDYTVQRFTWSAPIVAAGFMKQVTVMTFKGLGTALTSLFQGDTATASSQVSGPVGIFVLIRDGSMLGYQFILMIIAVISLALAIMNVLPIPALDGGRLFVTMLFRVLRRPLRKDTENLIHGAGFAALMLLFVLITIVDVRRFF